MSITVFDNSSVASLLKTILDTSNSDDIISGARVPFIVALACRGDSDWFLTETMKSVMKDAYLHNDWFESGFDKNEPVPCSRNTLKALIERELIIERASGGYNKDGTYTPIVSVYKLTDKAKEHIVEW